MKANLSLLIESSGQFLIFTDTLLPIENFYELMEAQCNGVDLNSCIMR